MKEVGERLSPVSDGERRSGGRNVDYQDFARLCMSAPYNWFEFPREFDTKNQCSNVTSGIRRGEYTDFRPPHKWQAAQRSMKVYVRYLSKSEEKQ